MDTEKASSPSVAPGERFSAAAIWQLLERAGFLYPEKLLALNGERPAIHRTMERLLTAKHISRTLVYEGLEELEGHVSAVLTYSRTWMVQHLAVLRRPGALFAALSLNLAMADVFSTLPTRWVRLIFRPNNSWPARVYGRFARAVAATGASDIRTWTYLTGPAVDAAIGESPVEVHPATLAEWSMLEARVRTVTGPIIFDADDLSADLALLEPVSAAYESAGLTRRREIVLATRNGSTVGFGLLEFSSPGVNLSELTGAFRVHAFDGSVETELALIAHAQRRYRAAGRPACYALHHSPHLDAYEQRGFQRKRDYSSWTFGVSLIPAFRQHIRRLYGRHDEARE